MERNAWLEKRRTGIAVSDFSAILGLSPFKSPVQVYMDKIGLVEDREETLAMKLGRRLEPIIGELFTERTALQIVPGEITQHPTHPLILGTPDFLVVDRPAGMEAKTTAWAREDEWGEEMTDLVPMQYLIQCLGYLEITEREEWFLSLLVGGSRDFRIYRIPRNAEQQKRLIDFAENWWHQHVEKQVPPPLDATASSAAYLKRMFPRHVEGQIVPADEVTAELIATYAHEKEMLDALETRTDALKNQICGQIGDAEGIACEGYKITWKAAKDTERVKWEAVAKALNPPAELVKEHTSVQPGPRRFLLRSTNHA